MSYTQKSYVPKYGNKDDFMQNNIIEDIRYLVGVLNAGGDQTVLGSSIWANGFTVTSCISESITLPENATVTYNGPLTLCGDAVLTVPDGTTLTVL